jgi:hypothetical protein
MRAFLEWLRSTLWLWVFAAVFFVLFGLLRWRTDPPLTLQYVRLSRLGVVTTATIESEEGYMSPRIVYAYSTPDGVRHTGRAEQSGQVGQELLVYYLPGEPDVSVPRSQWMELVQLSIAVLVGLAVAVSLALRVQRGRELKASQAHGRR